MNSDQFRNAKDNNVNELLFNDIDEHNLKIQL